MKLRAGRREFLQGAASSASLLALRTVDAGNSAADAWQRAADIVRNVKPPAFPDRLFVGASRNAHIRSAPNLSDRVVGKSIAARGTRTDVRPHPVADFPPRMRLELHLRSIDLCYEQASLCEAGVDRLSPRLGARLSIRSIRAARPVRSAAAERHEQVRPANSLLPWPQACRPTPLSGRSPASIALASSASSTTAWKPGCRGTPWSCFRGGPSAICWIGGSP